MSDQITVFQGKGELTNKQERALQLIVMGASQQAVAKDVGVHQSTIRNWAKDEFFASELKRRTEEAWEATANAMRTIFGEASHVAMEMLNDPDVSDSVKARLITAAWSNSAKWWEHQSFNERLKELEDKYEVTQ